MCYIYYWKERVFIYYWKERVFILLSIIITLTSCNRFKYLVRKSIRLRTFLSDRKSIIIIVHLSLKLNYERLLKITHFYELFKWNNSERNTYRRTDFSPLLLDFHLCPSKAVFAVFRTVS